MPPIFGFTSGTPALDFVGTRQRRRDPVPIEQLDSSADLDAWFGASDLVDEPIGFRQQGLVDARALREAIYSLITATMNGNKYDATALELVNTAAARASATPRLTARGRTVTATPEQALSTLARDAIGVVTGPEAHLLKECADPGCTQVYVDRSRGARREWCSMEPCGNRMKAAAYRARKREAA